MKPTITQITLGFLATSAFLGLGPRVQAHECTLSDAAGRYGYTSSGSIVTPPVGPFTAVGHVTLTESGTFTGTQTTSIAGSLVAETVQGTYEVNSDCTGSATASVYHGITLARTTVFNIVWDIRQNEFRGVFLTPGTTISIQGRKMAEED